MRKKAWVLLTVPDVPENNRATIVPFETACWRAADANPSAVFKAVASLRDEEKPVIAGIVSVKRTEIIAMTVSNSTSVKPPRAPEPSMWFMGNTIYKVN
jgi:hypothetical protein